MQATFSVRQRSRARQDAPRREPFATLQMPRGVRAVPMDDDRVRLWVGAEDGIMRLSLLLSLLWAFLQEMHVGNLRSMFAKREATQLEEVLSSPEDTTQRSNCGDRARYLALGRPSFRGGGWSCVDTVAGRLGFSSCARLAVHEA